MNFSAESFIVIGLVCAAGGLGGICRYCLEIYFKQLLIPRLVEPDTVNESSCTVDSREIIIPKHPVAEDDDADVAESTSGGNSNLVGPNQSLISLNSADTEADATTAIGTKLPPPRDYGFSIALVNIIGCLITGILAPILGTAGPVWAVIGVGFLGGFTTFSTTVVDAIRLGEIGLVKVAGALAIGGWILSVFASLIGFLIGNMFVS